jgi:hypothetical protein
VEKYELYWQKVIAIYASNWPLKNIVLFVL